MTCEIRRFRLSVSNHKPRLTTFVWAASLAIHTGTRPPNLLTAMKEQLGLRLQPTKADTDAFVHRVEQTSEN
jgi:uncharacterized protein (TIGR03435 family)